MIKSKWLQSTQQQQKESLSCLTSITLSKEKILLQISILMIKYFISWQGQKKPQVHFFIKHMISTLSSWALKFHKKSSAVVSLWIWLKKKKSVRALCSSISRISNEVFTERIVGF